MGFMGNLISQLNDAVNYFAKNQAAPNNNGGNGWSADEGANAIRQIDFENSLTPTSFGRYGTPYFNGVPLNSWEVPSQAFDRANDQRLFGKNLRDFGDGYVAYNNAAMARDFLAGNTLTPIEDIWVSRTAPHSISEVTPIVVARGPQTEVDNPWPNGNGYVYPSGWEFSPDFHVNDTKPVPKRSKKK